MATLALLWLTPSSCKSSSLSSLNAARSISSLSKCLTYFANDNSLSTPFTLVCRFFLGLSPLLLLLLVAMGSFVRLLVLWWPFLCFELLLFSLLMAEPESEEWKTSAETDELREPLFRRNFSVFGVFFVDEDKPKGMVKLEAMVLLRILTALASGGASGETG